MWEKHSPTFGGWECKEKQKKQCKEKQKKQFFLSDTNSICPKLNS